MVVVVVSAVLPTWLPISRGTCQTRGVTVRAIRAGATAWVIAVFEADLLSTKEASGGMLSQALLVKGTTVSTKEASRGMTSQALLVKGTTVGFISNSSTQIHDIWVVIVCELIGGCLETLTKPTADCSTLLLGGQWGFALVSLVEQFNHVIEVRFNLITGSRSQHGVSTSFDPFLDRFLGGRGLDVADLGILLPSLLQGKLGAISFLGELEHVSHRLQDAAGKDRLCSSKGLLAHILGLLVLRVDKLAAHRVQHWSHNFTPFVKVIVAQALQLDSGAILAVGRNLRSLILVFLIGQHSQPDLATIKWFGNLIN
jgi:hypothetical protein